MRKLLITWIVVLTGTLMGLVAHAVREPRNPAPDFEVTSARGVRLTAKDLRGRVVILNFWASWCAPCAAETPSLNALQDALREAGVVVLGISIDRDEMAYRAFLKRFHVGFETARDPDGRVSSRYGTFQIPETYIIDKNGALAAKLISNQDWMRPEVIQLVKSLL